MVDFALNLHNELTLDLMNSEKKYMLEGHPSHAPDAFGLNPPSQLIIRYHWLAFLNQVR